MENRGQMRKYIVILFSLLSTVAMAQESSEISMPNTEWLSSYTKVVVEGDVNVLFKRAGSDEGLKITYDPASGGVSRFRAGVDKGGVLTISQSDEEGQRDSTAQVTVWYNELEQITVSRATVAFEGVVKSNLIDMAIHSGATVNIPIDAMDAQVECTGHSLINIGGKARYFALDISSAVLDGGYLQTMASNIDASHDSEVTIAVSERLEAITTTSAKLYYRGNPSILRVRNSLFGGEISQIKQ